MKAKKKSSDNIEDVLSGNAFKILLILAEHGELHIPMIAEISGLSPKAVRERLKKLCAANVVQYKSFGKIRVFSMKNSSVRGRAVLQVIEVSRRDPGTENYEKEKITGGLNEK